MSIGKRIKELRKLEKITMETLAENADLGISTVSYAERDQSTPTAENLHKISKVLGCTMEYLLTGEDTTVKENVSVVVQDDGIVESLKLEIAELHKEIKAISNELIKEKDARIAMMQEMLNKKG